MGQSIIKKNIRPACEYCAIGRLSPDGQNVLCVKSGIRSLESSCSKFKYDILKRTPKRQPKLGDGFTQEDFRI